MTRGGRRGRPRARMQGVRGTVTSLCTFAPFSRAVGATLSAMLDPKQRHKLLRGDQTKDASWVRAAVEHLMASDPDLNLDEIEGVLRAAASTAYLVATAEGFEVVVGFAAWRRRAGRGRHDGGTEQACAGYLFPHSAFSGERITAAEPASSAASSPSPGRSARGAPPARLCRAQESRIRKSPERK